MRITLLGTGTSDGVPLVACSCPTCQSSAPENKRMRTSLLIEHQHHCILIDAGSDFRMQALKHHIHHLDAVLFTHADADHISGIPDLRAINWANSATLPIYAQKLHYSPAEQGRLWGIDMIYHQYRYAFNNEGGKQGRPSLLYHTLKPYNTLHINNLAIDPLSIMHGSMPILAFKIGRFAYVTDVSHIPDESMRYLVNQVDTLILSAVRYRPHPRHFHVDQAISVAQRIGAKQTYFVHISHDIEHHDLSSRLPAGIALAYDGLTLDFDF